MIFGIMNLTSEDQENIFFSSMDELCDIIDIET